MESFKTINKKTLMALALSAVTGSGCEYLNSSKDALNSSTGCLSASASLVGLSDTLISLKGNPKVGGSIVLLGASELQMSGNASAPNKIYSPSLGQVSKTGRSSYGQVIEQDFTRHEVEVLEFISRLAEEPADRSLDSVSSSMVLVGKGGVNFIRVNGDISLSSKDVLRFKGGSQDRFVIQVLGNVGISGSASLATEGGIHARNVLFILPNENSTLQITGNGKVLGTFFVTRGTAKVAGNGKLEGSIFAWNSIDINGNGLAVEPAPFCPGGWVPVSPSPTSTSSPTPTTTSSPSPTSAPSGTPVPGTSSSPEPTSSPVPSVSSTPEPSASPTETPDPTPTCSDLSCGVLGV
jgi:hypothetical protein